MAGIDQSNSAAKGQKPTSTGPGTKPPGSLDSDVPPSGPAGMEGLAIPPSGLKDDTFDRLLNSRPLRDPRNPLHRKGK
jgi:hypothetical protein